MSYELTKEQADAVRGTLRTMFGAGYLDSGDEDLARAMEIMYACDDSGRALVCIGPGFKLRAIMGLAHSFWMERTRSTAQGLGRTP